MPTILPKELRDAVQTFMNTPLSPKLKENLEKFWLSQLPPDTPLANNRDAITLLNIVLNLELEKIFGGEAGDENITPHEAELKTIKDFGLFAKGLAICESPEEQDTLIQAEGRDYIENGSQKLENTLMLWHEYSSSGNKYEALCSVLMQMQIDFTAVVTAQKGSGFRGKYG